MNSIDCEKIRLKELAQTNNSSGIFTESTKNPEWIPYERSEHLGSAITEYDSEEYVDLKRMLLDRYKEDSPMKDIVPIIMAADRKTKNMREDTLRKVDLYNYMM